MRISLALSILFLSAFTMAGQQQQQQSSKDGQSPARLPQDDDDDAPMVYVTPNDYASWAIKEKEVMRSQGEEAILQSEVKGMVPRHDGESPGDYAKRYSDFMNELVRRGVSILNDQTTHDQVPDRFFIPGHEFNVGPKSGVTKREYREFTEWISAVSEGVSDEDIPERFRKYEIAQPPSEPSY